MAAKNFKSAIATVRRPVKCFLGVSTLVRFGEQEIALFAPDAKQLAKICRDQFPLVEIDPKRFQKVAYFESKRITKNRRAITSNSSLAEKP